MTYSSVTVVSDVHGVLPVLEAVLAEPDVQASDLIVVNGDTVSGPMPRQTLDALSALGHRCLLVRGNGDREAVEASRGLPCDYAESLWAGRELRHDQLDLLATLPHRRTVHIAGFGPVLFCHATPDSDTDVVLVDTPLDLWIKALSAVDDDVRTVVCGHTHMPFLRFVDGRIVLNPGSLGMPYGRPGGSWALLRDGQIQLRHTPIDVDAACARIVAESDMPQCQAWVDEYVRAINTDVDALRAFAPLDGR